MVCGRMDTESTGVDRSGVVLVVSGYTNLTGNMNLIISFWCRNNCHGADPIAGSTGLPVSYPPHILLASQDCGVLNKHQQLH